MKKRKLRVGDKVKYKEGINSVYFDKEKILTIKKIINLIELNFKETIFVCSVEEVELIKPYKNKIKKLQGD